MSKSGAPDARLIALLLEEAVWDPKAVESSSASNQAYLEETVFPTLIPAIASLLETVHAREEQQGGGFATGEPLPIRPTDWLAQYLMRNNTAHSHALHSHPYNVLRRGLKAKKNSSAKS